MVKIMNISQLNSKMRQIQNKTNQQLKKIQRDTERQIKRETTKMINDYKKNIRKNYQKLQKELNRFNNSQHMTTKYTISVKNLNSSYEKVNATYNQLNSTTKEKEIFNHIEQENVNNLTVANTLISSDAEEDIGTELQDNVIGNQLKKLSDDLNNRWLGAIFALNPHNPDATRHFCTSTREIFTEIFDKYAKDKEVFSIFPDCDKTDRGNATRKSKIKYFLYKKGIDIKNADEFIDNDIDNILELYHILSDGTHGEAGRYNIIQLKAIKKRVEDGINFLCSIVI